MDRERNLLFGLIAAKWHGVDPDRLDAVVKQWQRHPESSLPKRVVAAGLLSERDGRLIWVLVKQAEHYFEGDRRAALDAFGGEAEALQSMDSLARQTSRKGAAQQDFSQVRAVEETPDRYALQRELGSGGMGRVLLVHDTYLGRDVALKEALADAPEASRPELSPKSSPHLARFLREARVTGRLDHPSIVPVHELGRRADGRLYYTMRLVPGRTLEQAVKEAGAWQERLRLLPHFVDLCQAVAYAHSRGVLHRDLKPANVMIGEFGETVVLDWGLAKEVGEQEAKDDGMVNRLRSMGLDVGASDEEAAKTAMGAVMGTPAYMSPEQARGDVESIDERSDVYALGAVLYELLTGQLPFADRRAAQVLHGVLHEEPPAVLSIEPNVPQELAAVCERAMQKQPEARYAHVRDLAEDIERFQSGRLVQTYAYGMRDHLRRFVMRNKAAVASGLVALLAVIVMALIAYSRVVAQRNRAEQEFYRASIVAAQNCLASYQPAHGRTLLAACPEHLRNWEWGYVQHLCNQELVLREVHNGSVLDVGFSPDGRCLAVAGEDGSVRVFDVATAEEIHVFQGHTKMVRGARYDPEGRRIVSASHDGTARIWDAQTGQEILVIQGDQGVLQGAVYSPDGERIATAGGNGTVKLWHAATGEALLTIAAHQDSVQHVAFSPDGSRLATSDWDGTARLWDAATGVGLRTFEGHRTVVKMVVFSPDGRLLATAGDDDCTARIWDVETGECLRTLASEGSYIMEVAFSPDGGRLATAGGNGRADLWEVATGLHLRSFAHEGNIHAMAFDPNGSILVTGSSTASLKFWDVAENASVGPSLTFPAGSRNLAFHPDGTAVAYSAPGGGIEVRDVRTARVLKVIGDTPVEFLAFSPDGRTLASRTREAVCLWDFSTGARRWEVSTEGAPGRTLAFGADGSFLAAGAGGSVVILDADSGEQFAALDAQQGFISGLACSPDGKHLASVGVGEELVQLYRCGTWKKVRVFSGHEGRVTSVAFSPDGRILATGGGTDTSADNSVRLWDVATGKQIRCMEGHIRRVEGVGFSADGSRLASAGGYDHTIRIWEVKSGREILVITAHVVEILSVAFSPDGRLLSSSDRNTGAIWPALPWQNAAYPGDDSMPLEERIDLLKLERYRERAGR